MRHLLLYFYKMYRYGVGNYGFYNNRDYGAGNKEKDKAVNEHVYALSFSAEHQ